MPENSPIVLIDSRLPYSVIDRLSKVAEPILLEPQPGVYAAISAHPDIFFCLMDGVLVHSPALSPLLLIHFREKGIPLLAGDQPPSDKYPASAHYNAVVTTEYLIHCRSAIDPAILRLSSQRNLKSIWVRQGYTRCNLLPLNNNRFITSDRGILRALSLAGLEVFYYPPDDILLPGFSHGFIGGCAGVWPQKVFFTGQPQDKNVRKSMEAFIEKAGMSVEYLSEGRLIDGGSLLFV